MDILTYGLLNKKIEEAKNVSGEKITEAVNTYLDENPPTTGATAEQAEQIDKNVADIGSLKGDLNALTDAVTVEKQHSVTETLSLTWTSGYVTPAGAVFDNNNYNYSNKIDVTAGDVIKLYRELDGAIIPGFIRFVTTYSGNEAVASKGSENMAVPYTVPEGIDGIVITIASAYGITTGDKTRLVSHIEPLEKEAVDKLYELTANNKPNRLSYTFNVSANATYTTVEQPEDMCGYRICFDCKISSYNGITKIGKGIGLTYGGGIGFDGTNLYQYFSTGTSPTRTQAHGLTLKDYVSIVLDVGYGRTAKVTISTNGGSYTWEIPYWRSYYGSLSVTSESALTNCRLSYTCEGLQQAVWLFGDSYFDYLSNTRWTYYLTNSGHTNYLINGYGGRNSQQALIALHTALSMNYTPRKIVWCLGMNDKDGSDDPNANWLECVEELINICTDKHIELILSTIPNVPSTNTKNTLKNAYVVESGYRYIDFAHAVSANGDSTWYDNMLSNDNVHPDVQGGLALYNCAVSEIPELLL